MTTTTVSPRLSDLATRINTEHIACEAAARNAVQHAVNAGALLNEAKASVPHGQWSAWVAEHCTFSERTARNYMRIARELPSLSDAKRQRVADLPSVRAAIAKLGERDEASAIDAYSAAVGSLRRHSERLTAIVNRIRSDGVLASQTEIRELEPFPATQCQRWFDAFKSQVLVGPLNLQRAAWWIRRVKIILKESVRCDLLNEMILGAMLIELRKRGVA